MTSRDPYWYDIASGSVSQAEHRPESACLGPFATAEEAAEAPTMLLAYARSWVESEEGQKWTQYAEDEGYADETGEDPTRA